MASRKKSTALVPWDEFERMLERTGQSKSKLAEQLGMTAQGVHRWRKTGVPKYAMAYLKLLEEARALRTFMDMERRA